MPVDTSMYGSIKGPEIMNPAQVVSLQNVARQGQLMDTQGQLQKVQLEEAQQNQVKKNMLREVLQTATDPNTGRLTPEGLAKITTIDPGMGLDLTKQQEQLRLQDVAFNEKKDAIKRRVGQSYVESYDRYLQQTGGNKEQAKMLAQKEALGVVDELEQSGTLAANGMDSQSAAKLRALPDPEQARALVRSLGGDIKEFTPGQRTERKRISGTNEIQEEWDPSIKAWKKIGEGPRFASMAGAGALSDDALTMAAEQFLAGDSTAVQGYARNADMKAKLTNKIAEVAKSKGMGGADVAAKVAEFQGMKAGERTLGTRTANIEMAVSEAKNMAPLALTASEKVNRTEYPTLNKVILAAEKGTGDENAVRLGIAVNSLINIYARAINPTGVPTVSDKDHARELLSAAWSKGQIRAGVDQLMQEMSAAQKSPGQVREDMRGAIAGREKPADSSWSDEKEERYQELLRKRGS